MLSLVKDRNYVPDSPQIFSNTGSSLLSVEKRLNRSEISSGSEPEVDTSSESRRLGDWHYK